MALTTQALSETQPPLLETLLSRGVLWQGSPAEAPPPWKATTAEAIPFGATEIDAALPHGGLACGAVHEFVVRNYASLVAVPTMLPAILSRNAIASYYASPRSLWKRTNTEEFPFSVLWIGRRCWPTPFSLPPEHLRSCLFIDPPTEKLALWAIETALRSPAVKLVIADAPRASLTVTRRLALAAKSIGATAILLRKHEDFSSPSAAASRWEISPSPSDSEAPAWELSLKRLKGGSLGNASWLITLEGGHEPGEDISLRVLPRMVSASHEEKARHFGT